MLEDDVITRPEYVKSMEKVSALIRYLTKVWSVQNVKKNGIDELFYFFKRNM